MLHNTSRHEAGVHISGAALNSSPCGGPVALSHAVLLCTLDASTLMVIVALVVRRCCATLTLSSLLLVHACRATHNSASQCVQPLGAYSRHIAAASGLECAALVGRCRLDERSRLWMWKTSNRMT